MNLVLRALARPRRAGAVDRPRRAGQCRLAAGRPAARVASTGRGRAGAVSRCAWRLANAAAGRASWPGRRRRIDWIGLQAQLGRRAGCDGAGAGGRGRAVLRRAGGLRAAACGNSCAAADLHWRQWPDSLHFEAPTALEYFAALVADDTSFRCSKPPWRSRRTTTRPRRPGRAGADRRAWPTACAGASRPTPRRCSGCAC